MDDERSGQQNTTGAQRLLYIVGGLLGVLLLVPVGLAVLLTRPGDDNSAARRDSTIRAAAPTRTPRPTGTPFPTSTPIAYVTAPEPTMTPVPTSTPVGRVMTPTPEPSPPATNLENERECDVVDGISLDVEGASRGWVRNEQGQYAIYHIGLLTDEIIEGGVIENVDYDRGDWGESYWLYDEGSYEAFFEIIDFDNHQFVIATYEQKTITGKAIFWPHVEPGATLRITFASGADPAGVRMMIDDDGDGEIDRTLEPDGVVTGRAACETVEPTVTAEVVEIEPGLAQLTFHGEDNDGGSGVAGFEYILIDEIPDPSAEPGDEIAWPVRYSEPVLIDIPGLVIFHGWDNAGNMTFWQEIVVLGGFGPDVTGTIQVGGAPVHVETPLPGQNALLEFEGKAGQRVAAVISDNTYGRSPNHIAGYARIVDPDGEVIARSGSFGSLDDIVEATLETDGTHTLIVDPFIVTTGAATVTLYAPADINGSISIGGPPVSVEFDTPGQRAGLTFEASAGQRLAIDAIALSLESGGCAPDSDSFFDLYVCNYKLELLGPDGEVIEDLPFVDQRGDQSDTITLPKTGTYTVAIDPGGLVTGTVDVRLLTFESTAVLVAGGPPVTVTMERPGDVASIGIAGEAHQTYLVTITDVTVGTSSCCTANYTVLLPNGDEPDYGPPWRFEPGPDGPHTVPEEGTYASPWNMGLPRLGFLGTDGTEFLMSTPEDGQYTLVIDPDEDTTGSLTVSIEKLGPSMVDATVNGPPVDLEIKYSEQPGIVQLTGKKGQSVDINVAVQPGSDDNYMLFSTDVRLFAPDGEVIFEAVDHAAAEGRYSVVLPADGVYWLELFNPFEWLATLSTEITAR